MQSVDKTNSYRLGTDSQVVSHERDRFKETPHVGDCARIKYDNSRGVTLYRSPDVTPSREPGTPQTSFRPPVDRER
ncbi:KfrB domain-containing protein [Sphingomonas sp. STIS6.2]|uniref:KfrB domain-containing protein n=1 Tax=Sphingomonas sp. STIS6.2 TaxID=1379700 RepID=UPI003FA3C1D1